MYTHTRIHALTICRYASPDTPFRTEKTWVLQNTSMRASLLQFRVSQKPGRWVSRYTSWIHLKIHLHYCPYCSSWPDGVGAWFFVGRHCWSWGGKGGVAEPQIRNTLKAVCCNDAGDSHSITGRIKTKIVSRKCRVVGWSIGRPVGQCGDSGLGPGPRPEHMLVNNVYTCGKQRM